MKNCYCGHPESSHENGRYGKNCWHCDCKRFAESQEPKALEEKCCRCENGIEYWPGFSIACTCKCHAKPQEEPKCADCGEKKSWHKEDWHEFVATDKESETDEKKFLKYLHIEPPAIIEGGHSYYVKDEILKAFRQFLKSLEK